MKYFYFILILVALASCSNDDSTVTNPISTEKLISKIDNGEGAVFLYEGDHIVKGVGNSSINYDEYYNAFQVEYENNKVKRVYHSHSSTSFPKPVNFNFDLSDGTYQNIKVMEYNYANNKLVSITEDGSNLYNFNYDSSGRVEEETKFDGLNLKITKFLYDSSGKVSNYITTYSNTITAGSFVTDTHSNPNYILWKKYNFVFPPDVSSFTNFNTRYFPNNKITLYNGEVVIESPIFTYDSNNYPFSYKRNLGHTETIEYL